jgi:hypothetical protein
VRSLTSSGAPAVILSMGIASAASVGGCTSLYYAQNQQRLQTRPSYLERAGRISVMAPVPGTTCLSSASEPADDRIAYRGRRMWPP